MFKFAAVAVAVDAQHLWSTGSPDVTTLEAVSASELRYNLAHLEVDDGNGDGSVSLHVPGWSQLEVAGEPDLPVLRASMALPRGAKLSDVRAVVEDAKVETVALTTWGASITPSKGKCSLCGHCNVTAPSREAYSSKFPLVDAVSIEGVHTWRDVQYAIVEVRPVAVDHSKGVADVLHSCSIKLEGISMDGVQPEQIGVEPVFLEVYKFVFSNWEHQAHAYKANDSVGRVLVIYDSALESQAKEYSTIVKQRLNPSDIIMYEAESSSSAVQSKIRSHYQEAEKLAYVTIIGRDVPSPRGDQTGGMACDNCYVMLSGGTDLDIPIGRISGQSSGVDSYLNKLQKYDSSCTDSWTKNAYGTYAVVMNDEQQAMTNIMNNLKQGGFNTDFTNAQETSGQESAQKMEAGLGVFSYIGHGSGTAWNTPRFSVDEVESLTNTDKIFFEIDVSCDNGNFQEHSPCMGEALITSKGGAIATMMSSPEMKGTMCKRYQEQAALAISTGVASRVGNIYNIGLMKGNSITRDAYTMQAYNVFGDPTQIIIGAVNPPPSPTPVPTPPTPSPPSPPPTPVPTPAPSPPEQCHAISALVTDDWCVANCAMGNCPADLCSCNSAVVV